MVSIASDKIKAITDRQYDLWPDKRKEAVNAITSRVMNILNSKEGLDWIFMIKRLVGATTTRLVCNLVYDVYKGWIEAKTFPKYDFTLTWWASSWITAFCGGWNHCYLDLFSTKGCGNAKDFERRLYAYMKWMGVPDELNYKGKDSLSSFRYDYSFNTKSPSREEAQAFWDKYNEKNKIA